MNFVSEVSLSILSLDFKALEKIMPPEIDPGVIYLVMGPALTLLCLESSLGFRVACINMEGTIASLEPLPLCSGPSMLRRLGGSEVPLGHENLL